MRARARKKAAAPGGPRDGGDRKVHESSKATVACDATDVHPRGGDLARQFLERFAELERAYGRFTITSKRGGKVEGSASLI